MPLFTPDERERTRSELIAHARQDATISGAALVGSAARGTEDAWSDIDLVLQLARDADEPEVVDAWTRWMRGRLDVADTFDVIARGGVRYRVFLLTSSLQIDVSFWPHDRFRATEPGFRLLFGTPGTPTEPAAMDAASAIGMGWLYALHARSALARGRPWQATLMLDELRTTVLTLAANRLGLNPWHGRDVDRLPADLLDALARARATRVDDAELRRSLAALVDMFRQETSRHDPQRSAALAAPLDLIAAP